MVNDPEVIQVKQLLEESFAIKSILAERFGVTLEIIFDDPHALLHGDRSLLRAALGNLIDDAIKMNNRGRKVLIRQHSDGGSVVIDVFRPGNGIGGGGSTGAKGLFAGQQPVCVEMDGKAHPGMSLARHIAVLHGGRIYILIDNGHATGSALHLPLSRLFTSI